MYRDGGYQNLLVYQLATTIFDLAAIFCERYVEKISRTRDQMIQAARSGKQNIAEGSLEKSLKGYIKLIGVSRGSFGELLEDFKDFLRQRGMKLWAKDDPRVVEIRAIREDPNLANLANWANTPYGKYMNNPEGFANLMIVLIYKENYLLDQLSR
ncbi:four helix bundle protein, partial [Candidatus Amesbacteria bacterium]|nr:four helix bundle protein [Candidatus Amesbacteria bacterium]